MKNVDFVAQMELFLEALFKDATARNNAIVFNYNPNYPRYLSFEAHKLIGAIKNLSKFYGDTQILFDVNLEVKKGEIFAIVGHSGAGKSTLLRCINGLESYQGGSLKVFDQEIKNLDETQQRHLRRDVGMIFQHFALMARKNVFENVATPLKFWGYKSDETEKRVRELLNLVGLENKAKSYPSELSGGQRQRVYIARALCANAKVLILDEPTASIDTKGQAEIYEILKGINANGVGVVLVSHDLNIVLNYATKIAYVSKNLHIHKTHENLAKREFIEHLARTHSHFCDVEIALGECGCEKTKSNVFKF